MWGMWGMTGPGDFSTTCALDELVQALNKERLLYPKLSPKLSCESVYCFGMSVQCVGHDKSLVKVASRSIATYGQALVLAFAKNAHVEMDAWLETHEWCMIEARDSLAIRRGHCRRAVLPFLSQRLFAGLPRDMRVFLARTVWNTRKDGQWTQVRAEIEGKRVKYADE